MSPRVRVVLSIRERKPAERLRALGVDLVEPTSGPALRFTRQDGQPVRLTDASAVFAAATRIRRGLTDRRYRRSRRTFDALTFGTALCALLDELPDAEPRTRDAIVDLAAAFVAETGRRRGGSRAKHRASRGGLFGIRRRGRRRMPRQTRRILRRLPALTRLKWYLAYLGHSTELVKVVRFERGQTTPEIVKRYGRRYVRYPYFSHAKLGIPRYVYRAGAELTLRSRVHSVAWRGGKLHVTGEAQIRSCTERYRWLSVKGFALRSGRRLLVTAGRTIRRPASCPGDPQAWAGFSVTLDPRRLRKKGRWVEGTWKVAAGVLRPGAFRYALLRAGAGAGGACPPHHYVADGVRVVPVSVGGCLRIRVERVRARASACRWDGAELVIEGTLREAPRDTARDASRDTTPTAGTVPEAAGQGGSTVRLSRGGNEPVLLPFPVAGDGTFEARIPLAELCARSQDGDRGQQGGSGQESVTWRVEVLVAGRWRRLVLDEEIPASPFGSAPVVPFRTRDGYLAITSGPVRPVLVGCELDPDATLALTGQHPETRPAAIVLRARGRQYEHAFPLDIGQSGFRVRLPLASVVSVAGELPLRAGRWEVLFRPYGGQLRPVRLDHNLALPEEVRVDRRPYRVDRQPDGGMLIEVGSNLSAAETHGRRRLWRAAVRRARRLGLRDAVLFISYSGKQYADSPRAIHEELVRRGDTREQLWEVNDGQVAVPPTVTPVRRRGTEWYEALATCRYIVTNVRLPEFFERRPDQIVVQTWHGTPLKKVGRDIKEVHFSYAPGMETVRGREPAAKPPEWSYLVSPNRFSTEILGSAFASSYGEILEVGYPRNDVLHSPDADVISKQARARLGIPPDKRVVLYAPTWRDDQFYGRGRYKLDFRLDLRHAAAVLGEDHVLLVRLHSNIVDALPETGDGFVRDVSRYPDIAELYLLSDVLVTDYSSVLFDYANTGKPMLFFTYDLEYYRDVLRGFYFDFENAAPGPLLRTSSQVIDAIRHIDEVVRAYRSRYARFAARFCELDDGKAAGRAVDRIFGAGTGTGQGR